LHKLNILQIHLTDDQGWRIEIKKYPKLGGNGARLPDYGGRTGDGWFYSQAISGNWSAMPRQVCDARAGN